MEKKERNKNPMKPLKQKFDIKIDVIASKNNAMKAKKDVNIWRQNQVVSVNKNNQFT